MEKPFIEKDSKNNVLEYYICINKIIKFSTFRYNKWDRLKIFKNQSSEFDE